MASVTSTGRPTKLAMKLMIVDDHAGTRDLIRELAGPLAKEIHEFASGTACLMGYAAIRPDLVTLDLDMRPVDGFTTLAELRRRDREVHVVIVTQTDDPALRRQSMRLGASAYIEKSDLRLLREYLIHFTPSLRR